MGESERDKAKDELNDLFKQLESNITFLQQQLGDKSSLIISLETKNSDLKSELVEKSSLVEAYEEEDEKFRKEISDLSEDNKTLRRARKNDQVDINNLRNERKELQNLLDRAIKESEQLVMLAEPPPEDTEPIIQEEVAEADWGKYDGLFVCSREVSTIAQRFFNRLVKAFPQINWGDAPEYLQNDQSTLRFREGIALVVFFPLKMTHPAIGAMKRDAKLAGANVMIGANINKMIGIIKKWLENPNFGTGEFCDIG